MSIFRLADRIARKYKKAEATELEKKKADILRAVSDLWKASVGGLYGGILRDLTATDLDPDVKYPDKHVGMAKDGQEFLIKLLNTIDVFKSNLTELPFDVLRDKLVEIVQEIEENMDTGADGVDFPTVTSLVWVGTKGRTVYEREKFQKSYYGKARKGLVQLHSMAQKILNSLNIFEGIPSVADPDKKYRHHQRSRLRGKPAALDQYEIFPFLMQYGNSYGLQTQQDWATVFRDDPELLRQIQKTIHALNSGHYPRNAEFMKAKIDGLLKAHKARMATNAPALEMGHDEFKEQFRPRFISPELKKEKALEQQQRDEAKQEEAEKLRQIVQQRDEAWERRQPEELLEQQKKEEEERLKNKFSSPRMEQILKRYQ